jgi:hypothetical protein
MGADSTIRVQLKMPATSSVPDSHYRLALVASKSRCIEVLLHPKLDVSLSFPKSCVPEIFASLDLLKS